MKKSKSIIVIALLATIMFSAYSALAQMNMPSGEMEHVMNMGPMIGGKMLHAWISLAAAIVIFILAMKFMVGGKLSRPVMLMGFGALADAVIGIFPSHQGHMENMWLGSLLFSLSVVFGIIWMARIFGVVSFNKKQE